MIPARALSKVRSNAMGYRKRRWRDGLDPGTEMEYGDVLEALLEAESEAGEISHAVAAMCGIDERYERLVSGLTEAWITTAQRQVLGGR